MESLQHTLFFKRERTPAVSFQQISSTVTGYLQQPRQVVEAKRYAPKLRETERRQAQQRERTVLGPAVETCLYPLRPQVLPQLRPKFTTGGEGIPSVISHPQRRENPAHPALVGAYDVTSSINTAARLPKALPSSSTTWFHRSLSSPCASKGCRRSISRRSTRCINIRGAEQVHSAPSVACSNRLLRPHHKIISFDNNSDRTARNAVFGKSETQQHPPLKNNAHFAKQSPSLFVFARL